MQNDQRLTPLPVVTHDLQTNPIEFSAAYPSSYEDSIDSKRSIKQYINVVYKRLPIILAITILVTAAVAFYSYRLPSEFEATTSMIIEPRKPPQTSKEAVNILLGDDPKYYNTQLELLKSSTLMRKAVVALGYHRDANLFGDQGRGLLGGLRSLFNRGQNTDEANNSLPIVSESTDNKSAQTALTPEESKRADTYAGILAGGLNVTPLAQTQIVNLNLRCSDPIVAAKAVDKIAEIFKRTRTAK